MEKRRCVKTDEITVNMLVHALRDVFREEKEAGASTKETGDIENGRYTDGIDTVLMRIMNARYRTYRTR